MAIPYVEPRGKAALPWNALGFRLWSLYEMHNFILHRLIGTLDFLRTLENASRQAWASPWSNSGNARISPDAIKQFVEPPLQMVKGECEFLDLRAALDRINQQLHIKLRDGITYNELEQEAKFLRELIDNDLPFRRFAYVPDSKAKISDGIGRDWEQILKRIPKAKYEVEESVYCYALGRSTACVFHLMRVAEMGLRKLAASLKVKITHSKTVIPIEFGEWDKVITAIKNEIASARSLPAGPKRQKKLERYSDAADHCSFMKDIWRNNVSHTRKPYSEQEALAVMGRIKDFMNFVALG